jgi:low temperature requirement protein LtrA
MRGLVVPELTEDFTADPVELFFDLAFVFAFSQLVSHLVHHPTWTGAAQAWLLFAMLWMAWSTFTWSANAVSGNAREVRFIFLVATAATMPAAGGVTSAYQGGGAAFAISVSVIIAMALALQLWAHETGSEQWVSVLRYAWPNVIAMALFVVGGFISGETRVVLWLIGLGSILFGTIMAGSSDWIVRIGHFAERHGLILIIALGEVLVAIGIALVDSLEEGGALPGSVVVALVAAGSFAGLLWWAYFDRLNPALEHRGDGLEGRQRGRFARDIYTYVHALIVSGVIISAAALEEVILHPGDPVPLAFRVMLAGGLLMFLLGTVLAVERAFGVVIRERIVVSAMIVVLVALGGSLNGVSLLLLVDGLLLAVLVAEYMRIERPTPAPAESS